MTFGLVDVSYSLPEGQAVKLTFFAPWLGGKRTFYNFEIGTNYEIYKIRVNVSTFLYTL